MERGTEIDRQTYTDRISDARPSSDHPLSKRHFSGVYRLYRGPGSVVGIATAYGLDGPGIESRLGEIFRTCPDRPWGPHSLLYNGYRVFPGGKVLPGRDAELSPPSSAEV